MGDHEGILAEMAGRADPTTPSCPRSINRPLPVPATSRGRNERSIARNVKPHPPVPCHLVWQERKVRT